MILRIVRMVFQPDRLDAFRETFAQYEDAIRSQDGCTQLILMQDAHRPEVFFTYSKWESLEKLEAYRHSQTFGEVWPKTKALFAEAPQAWSLKEA